MDKRKTALLLTVCILTINIINFIIEAWIDKVQASSFILDNKSNKVVIFMVDNIQLEDYTQDSYLNYLLNNSFSAFVSGRQNGKVSEAKAKLAIGSGHRLDIGNDMKLAYKHSDDKIIYNRLSSLIEQNINSDYRNYIGYIGNEVHKKNLTTCLIGNSDINVPDRSAALITMDSHGIIDMGNVDNTVIYDSNFPGGVRTDYSKVLELYNYYYTKSDILTIDIGDLTRLEYYKSKLKPESYELYRETAINDISQLINTIISQANEKTSYILLSSYPAIADIKAGFKLMPIIVHDNSKGGLLYSDSTRRIGIITSLDIADYILKKLRVTDNSSIEEIKLSNVMSKLIALKRKLLNVSVMRLPVLTWYAIFEIICAIACFLYMLNFNHKKMILANFVKISMLANIVAPAILLYVSIFDISNAAAYFVLFILFSYLLALILFKCFKSFKGQFLAAAIFVNASLVIDLIRGSAFMKNSVFGYDPIIGARFYGIGNEFAGVFIGSGILLMGCFLQLYEEEVEKRPKATSLLLASFSCFQLYMIGMPFIGANFGGTIAAVFGYYFFYASVKKRKLSIAQLLILLMVLIMALTSIILMDLLNPSNTTHIGKFIADIKENGINVLIQTLARKAAMNIRLIKYTIWTKVLLCIILIITIMFFKPVRLLHNIFKKYRYFTAAWLGLSAGSIAGLIANDSGIVMAATAMIFTGYTILYMCLEERSVA